MTDIELVIRISKEDFEIMKHNIAVNNPLCPLSQEEMVSKVANGTPLPKGHGRLIDANSLRSMYSINRSNFNTIVGIQKWIDDAPTIIEADKAESEDNG